MMFGSSSYPNTIVFRSDCGPNTGTVSVETKIGFPNVCYDSRSLVRSGLLSESILSGFGQESVVLTLVRTDQFEA